MEATIVFANGTQLNAEKNGNCLIVNNKPTFPEDLTTVTVTSSEGTEVYKFAKVQECASTDGRYWFIFVERSADEIVIDQMIADNKMLEDAIIELAELIGG